MNKIFGIGLGKTGTRSLADALRHLGHRTLHKGDQATSDLVVRAEAEGVPLLTHVGTEFTGYLNVQALVDRFAALDEQYPDSKFILTTRDLPSWLDSRERHRRANQERAARGEYDGPYTTIDRDGWIAEREAHHSAVHAHFADRPDQLLVMDIVNGDGWELLAPFLGAATPAKAFPWENKAGAGTYRPRSSADRVRSIAKAGLNRLRR